MYKLNKIKILGLLSVLILLIYSNLFAVEIKYDFKAGYKYYYELSVKSKNKTDVAQMSFNQPEAVVKKDFSFYVVQKIAAGALIDILYKHKIVRRYVDNYGRILSAPCEGGKSIPFFLTFARGDWQVGQTRVLKHNIFVGKLKIPASIVMKLAEFNDKNKKAVILLNTKVNLPFTKPSIKKFTMKGKIIFDLSKGCIEKYISKFVYKFSFNNKELAIKRHLWDFVQENTAMLKLIKVEKAE